MNVHDLLSLPPWDWPVEAHEMILEALRDAQAPKDHRRVAVELAGELVVMEDRLAEELLGILTDPQEPAELRAGAAIALGPALEEADMEGPEPDPEYLSVSPALMRRATLVLREIHDDPEAPKLVRRRALEGAVRWPEPWQIRAVREAFRSADREWKITAVFCMQILTGFKEEVREVLDTDDPVLLKETILAAGTQEVEEAWPLLEDVVSRAVHGPPRFPDLPDHEREILFAVIETAPLIRPEETQELLDELVELDDPDVHSAVEENLEIAGFLLEEWEEDEEEEEEDLDGGVDDGRVWH